MARPQPQRDSLVVLFASAVGTDAPSFIITPNGIIPIPGWGVDIVADLNAAANLHVQATQFKGSPAAKRELESAANKIVQGRAEEIRAYSRQISGGIAA